MSNFLNQVSTGVSQDGQRIVIAAVEKAGKTTLVANAPRSLLIPVENGYAAIKTPRTPMITNWNDMISLMEELRNSCMRGTNIFQTLSLDSFTAIERLIHEFVISSDPDLVKARLNKTQEPKNLTMETCHGGYGKGYALANLQFEMLLSRFDELARNAKINIVGTCHVFPSVVKDAAYGEYNSWDLLLHSPKNDKTYGKREMLTQWVDMLGFLHEPLFVMKQEKGQTLSKGVSANQGRMLAVDRTPGWVAGNRYGLTGLIPIPEKNGWNSIAHAIYESKGIDLWNRDV